MNSLRFHTIILVALLATFSGGSDAWARPPRPRTESGVIESVDHTARSLRLHRSDQSEPLTVIWDPRTRILAESQFTNASRLQAGERVDVSYRTPFFGQRYATKIVLVAQQNRLGRLR